MDSMPSLRYFKEKTTDFILNMTHVSEADRDEVIEQIEWFIEKTGGWETHYQIMLEGMWSGFSFDQQLETTAKIWKTIKFKFGG